MQRAMILAVLGAAGCAAGAPDDPCGAARFAGTVGAPYDAALFQGADPRVIGPDTAVTLDYLEERLNVTVDAGGTILTLSCG
ncbi:MAG: I78 family peptidase inhibitor [Paracoccaceae bacterium]